MSAWWSVELGPLVLFVIKGTKGRSAFALTFGHCHKKCKGWAHCRAKQRGNNHLLSISHPKFASFPLQLSPWLEFVQLCHSSAGLGSHSLLSPEGIALIPPCHGCRASCSSLCLLAGTWHLLEESGTSLGRVE